MTYWPPRPLSPDVHIRNAAVSFPEWDSDGIGHQDWVGVGVGVRRRRNAGDTGLGRRGILSSSGHLGVFRVHLMVTLLRWDSWEGERAPSPSAPAPSFH